MERLSFCRRDVLGGLAAGLGWSIIRPAWAVEGLPDLKVGVLSDIHLSDEAHRKSKPYVAIFEKTLRFYQKEGVDAVIVAGDLTNGGRMSEMRVVIDAWKRVFAGGPEPVRVFVTGNHEVVFYQKALKAGKTSETICSDALYADVKANWRKLFDEEWSPFFIKRVKGYAFVGAHWGENLDGAALKRFLEAHRDELRGPKPFFFVQHAHPKNTCYGPTAWDQTNGGATSEVLSAYPNAVAFSGHTHSSLVDERSVWQGSFTSVGTAALRCVYLPGGRENSGAHTRMPWMRGGSQGMLMSVCGNVLRLERYNLSNFAKLGEDWKVSVPGRDFDFATRARFAQPPAFPSGAAISVQKRRGRDPENVEEEQLVVSFPAARGHGDALSRAFDYEVVVEGEGKPCVKRVYQPGVLGEWKPGEEAPSCVFGVCELPKAPSVVRVTPCNSYGLAGVPLVLSLASAEI